MKIDTVIFGGGAAGLWLLDTLVRRGVQVLLLESGSLGSGQTVAAQGIIHGGLKYTLQGMLTPSAASIRDMPSHWLECLEGASDPDLRGVRIRAPHCHLWRTNSLGSRLGMVGARVGLRVAPIPVGKDELPAVLADCPGGAVRLDEPVIAPDSLIGCLASRHRGRILKIAATDGAEFKLGPARDVRAIRMFHPTGGPDLELEVAHVVFTAGSGNADLRRRVGLSESAMQRRPLHMVLLRGDLPALNGHCVDGSATRVTITSERDSAGRMVWQVGGQLAEIGVPLNERELIAHAKSELTASIPGLDLRNIEWSTYRVDRAERATRTGARPDTAQVLSEANVLTAWPTKLALAPLLAAELAGVLNAGASAGLNDLSSGALSRLHDWPRPEVAKPPWELSREWTADHVSKTAARRAA